MGVEYHPFSDPPLKLQLGFVLIFLVGCCWLSYSLLTKIKVYTFHRLLVQHWCCFQFGRWLMVVINRHFMYKMWIRFVCDRFSGRFSAFVMRLQYNSMAMFRFTFNAYFSSSSLDAFILLFEICTQPNSPSMAWRFDRSIHFHSVSF